MRLAFAGGILALALTASACRTPGTRPMGEKDLAAKLRALGIEGKTYVNDLGQVSSIHLNRVFACGPDLLIEDIHGHLTYVDGATLNPRWDFYGLPGPFDMPPDCTPSAVIGLSGGKLFVLARSNGVPQVEPREVDVVPSGRPVATDSTIYVPTFPTPAGNRTIYSINLATGYHGWGWRTDHDIVGALAKAGPNAGDEFYFTTSDGMLYAFPTFPADAHQIDPGWITNLHSGVSYPLALDGADIAVVPSDGRLVCVDRITGAVRWEAYAGAHDRAEGGAQFSKNCVFYVCGGELRAFARDTGARLWAVPGATGVIAERGGRMLLSGEDGMLISVDAKTGKVLGHAGAPGWYFPPRTEPDQTLCAVSRDGEVFSVEVGF